MPTRAWPDGWVRLSPERARRLHDELQRELSEHHALFGVSLEAVADRDGASDDVVFRCLDEPERFIVVHLTWRGRVELDARWPSVALDGSFEELREYDRAQWGRRASDP